MAGGALKFRHLSRDSAHRQALLRNLVTSLIAQETITTTWPKAKEAQRLAEKLITLGKKNTNASRTRAQQILFTPFRHLNRLFGELRERYADRPGGYTRVLRIEPRNHHHDQAPTAILELVDGPKDIRFAMTARTLVRERAIAAGDVEKGIRDVTARNVLKVTRFRPEGEADLEREVIRLEGSEREEIHAVKARRKEEKEEEDRKEEEKGKRQRRDRRTDLNRGDDAEYLPFVRGEPKQGWERYDHFNFEQRKKRKLQHKLQELEDKQAEKKRLRAAGL